MGITNPFRRSLVNKLFLPVFITITSLVLDACVQPRSTSTGSTGETVGGPESTQTTSATPTPTDIEVFADCGWRAEVFVWIDINGDGIRSDDEPPKEGVEVIVNDTLNDFDSVGIDTTSFDGLAYPDVWLPGCPEARFEVLAVTPHDYELTTASPIPAEGSGYGSEGPYEFGFHPLSEAALPPDRVPRYTCKLYTDDLDVTNLEVGPDGTLWGSGFFELARFDFTSDEFIVLPREDLSEAERHGPDGWQFGGNWGDTRFGSDGSIWLHDWMNALHYDGSYDVYSEERSLQVIGVPATAQSPDGTLWFTDSDDVRGGPPVYTYQPKTNEWHVYTWRDDYWGNLLPRRIATNGTHWLLELDPENEPYSHIEKDSYEWTITEFELTAKDLTVVPEFSGTIHDIDITADGIVWMADGSGFLRFDPSNNLWTRYDAYAQGIDGFYDGNDLAIAPDGSLWTASGERFGILIQLVLPSANGNQAEWHVYDVRDGLTGFGTLLSVAATPDGSIWTTGYDTEGNSSENVARCQPIAPPK